MEKHIRRNTGIQALLKKYKSIFRIPENQNHYSDQDYKLAERKFLKYALIGNLPPLPQQQTQMRMEIIAQKIPCLDA